MLERISESQIQDEVLTTLGVDNPQVHLNSIEVVAGALRRAGGFFCPCSAASLIKVVSESYYMLVSNLEEFKKSVEQILEELLALGDLQERKNVGQETSTLIYLAPPAFVHLTNGITVILGVIPDHPSVLPENVQKMVKHKGVMRYVLENQELLDLLNEDILKCNSQGQAEKSDLRDKQSASYFQTFLVDLGFIELSEDDWLKVPSMESPLEYIARFERILTQSQNCGDLGDILILDYTQPVRYYPKRWRPKEKFTGRYVARRPQKYGNDLWCYLEIDNGVPSKMIDLPAFDRSQTRGCDEAWMLQAALDAYHGHPQQLRVQPTDNSRYRLDVFSPIPNWLERRWNWIGQRIENVKCLISFEFSDISIIEKEVDFAKNKLWLVESKE